MAREPLGSSVRHTIQPQGLSPSFQQNFANRSGANAVNGRPLTAAGHARRFSSRKTDVGCHRPLRGVRIARRLRFISNRADARSPRVTQVGDDMSQPPKIEQVDVLAAKLP